MKNARKKQHGRLNRRRLRALAEDFDRRYSIKATPRALPNVSEAELIALGGVKTVVQINIKGVLQNVPQIVFGAPEPQTAATMVQQRQTQFSFTPHKAVWKVALTGKPSLEHQKRELTKSGRGLWDPVKQQTDVAFQAVESLLYCWHWFKGRPSGEQQNAYAAFAISSTLQALERDRDSKGDKLRLAFALLTDDQWPRTIDRLQEHSLHLAAHLQRPPSKKELKSRFDPDGRIHQSEFAKLLKHAGLAWLRREASRTR